MPTRREFLKLSAIAALGAAAGCAKPDGNPTARPTEAEPTKAIPPTKKIDVTDTPNVPATKEAERLNAILAEGYPTSFTELSQEKMLSEADFLKQLEKFPNIGKEYKQVKAMLSAGLSKEKVNLSDIAFEVSSFPWDTDKYSWIVIARNSKTGEVYVPRDAKTHTRNIDMSVYGYLKEYQAGGALPFTMEPLKLPEFSGPEYKVGFARSKKGWLVASLDGGPQKGWYNMRADVARWEDKNKQVVVLADGMHQELGEYSNSDQLEIDKMMSEISSAISANKIFASQESLTEESGICFPTTLRDITVGVRECKSVDGKLLKVAVAWRRSDGSYLLRAGDGNFVVARSRESGSNLVMRGFGSISSDLKLVFGNSWVNTDRVIMMMENPVDGSIYLPNGNGGVWIDRADIDLMAFNFLPKRQTPGYDAINYGRTKPSPDPKSFENLISGVRFVDVNGKDITQTDDQYVAKIRKILSKAGEVYSESEKAILGSFDKLILKISSAQTSFSSQSQHGNVDNFLTVPVAFLNRFGDADSVMSEIFLSYIVHESTHSTQKRGGDVEFQAFLNQLKFLVRRKQLLSNFYVSYFIDVLKTGNYLTQVK